MNIKATSAIPIKAGALAALAALALSGCGNSHQQVQAWMNTAAAGMNGKVEKIDEPRRFEPYKYASTAMVDPFDPAKAAPPAKTTAREEPRRRREALEAFPLESLTMVGMLRQKGETYALIKAGANLYRVKIGSYLGRDEGLVTDISETGLVLKETVRDAGGDLMERRSTLVLQEQPRA
ncbi:MAG TPA: pilus assembly protein PilP [Burkholderiales bacterium]|jgi:type IV pilus assembly protein PilP